MLGSSRVVVVQTRAMPQYVAGGGAGGGRKTFGNNLAQCPFIVFLIILDGDNSLKDTQFM